MFIHQMSESVCNKLNIRKLLNLYSVQFLKNERNLKVNVKCFMKYVYDYRLKIINITMYPLLNYPITKKHSRFMPS